MAKLKDHYGRFHVVSKATESAKEDYDQLGRWFSESRDPGHQAACNELYRWFCKADNKGTLAFDFISKTGG